MDKTCNKCGEVKNTNLFGKLSNSISGYRETCKICRNQIELTSRRKNKDKIRLANKKYRETHVEQIKLKNKQWADKNKKIIANRQRQYRVSNKEIIKEKTKQYRIANKETIKEQKSKYYFKTKNKESYKQKKKEYYIKNKAKRREYVRLWCKQDRQNNNINLVKGRLRNRIYCYFRRKNMGKNRNSESLVGCTFAFLTQHIENQFSNGMTWENKGKWHIDHIVPLANATNEEELLKLMHYTNLQPLWATENLKKGKQMRPWKEQKNESTLDA